MQIGAYLGYLSFGFIADRFGRRRTFILLHGGGRDAGADLRPDGAETRCVLMLLGPLLGFVGHGYFSMFGGFSPSCSRPRSARPARALTYNAGRLTGALAPFTIGALADAARDRHRPGAGAHVGVLPGGGAAHPGAAGPERPGARSLNRHVGADLPRPSAGQASRPEETP